MSEQTSKKAWDTPEWAPIIRPALQEDVVARLKTLIDDGVLLPGTRIPERQLCAQLGISRTPLREAFRVLAAAGLLELQPRRGATVKRLQPEELDHMFEVVQALEGSAAELACARISAESLSEIEELHKKMMLAYSRRQQRRFFDLNQEIHERIIKAAGNPILTRVYEGLSGQIRRIRYMARTTDEHWAIAVKEHEAIIEALKARNKRKLSRVLRTHVSNKARRVKSLLGK